VTHDSSVRKVVSRCCDASTEPKERDLTRLRCKRCGCRCRTYTEPLQREDVDL